MSLGGTLWSAGRCIKIWFLSGRLYTAHILDRPVVGIALMIRRMMRRWRRSISTFLGFLMGIEQKRLSTARGANRTKLEL
jgi:hypothetical protein